MNIQKRCTAPLTASRVRQLLAYDSKTGVFTWKEKSNCYSLAVIGAEAGYTGSDGYGYVKFHQQRHSKHRIAWLHFYGEWPTGEIDHVDGNKSNNAIENLRDVPHRVNMQNLKKAYATTASEVLGVTQHKSKWRARIRLNGKLRHIGLFHSKDEAHQAYLVAKRQLHEGNTL